MDTTNSTSKLDKIMRRVAALLAQADHANTSVTEAETFRAKAEALMIQYRISEATLAQGQPGGDVLLPVWRTWDVCDYASEYRRHYRSLASSVLAHFELRGVFNLRHDEGTSTYVVEACGYDSDLRMAEGLYTACRLAFAGKLEPRYDSTLSDQVNAYVMRSAGMEGVRIAEAIYGTKQGEPKWKANCQKVRKLFRVEAEARGEDPSVLLGAGNNMKSFREDYATGFANELYYRLRQMRMSRGDNSQGGLVLASRAERVQEAFYERFPEYRPSSGSSQPYVAPNHGCAKCAKAKSGYCREHGWLKPSQARSTERSTNMAAYNRGQSAAGQVDLGASPKGTRVDSSGAPRGEI